VLARSEMRDCDQSLPGSQLPRIRSKEQVQRAIVWITMVTVVVVEEGGRRSPNSTRSNRKGGDWEWE